MGLYDREYYRDDQSSGFNLGSQSMVTNLLIANVAIFLLNSFTVQRDEPLGQVNEILAVTGATIKQPWNYWKFLTYGFAHAGTMHIFGNMLGLFFFGRVIEGMLGPKKFLGMYLTAIVLGGSIWSISNVTVPNVPLVGASGGVVAVVLLFCIYNPRQLVYLWGLVGIPAWALGAFYVVSDVMGAFNQRNAGNVAFSVHLVGAAYAYIFYRTRFELGDLMSADWLKKLKPKPNLKVHRPAGRSDTSRPETGRSGAGRSETAELDLEADRILQKLHREGESSLTSRERKTLEEYSRRMKQKYR